MASAEENQHEHLHFSIQSVKNGKWSNAETWKPARVPGKDDRVLVTRGTHVEYDVASKEVVRLIQVVGTLRFALDRDTELNVGVLAVKHNEHCSEHGFACEFEGADIFPKSADDEWPSLLIGTAEQPIPAEYTARIRLHYLEGMDQKDAPAMACCSGRMEIHGTPLSRTWVKLSADVKPGDRSVQISQAVTGWRVGDAVIVTGSKRAGGRSYREGARGYRKPQTEERTIVRIDDTTIEFDKPLEYEHYGEGEFRSEVANLSRNVIIESADPEGVRGHTVYHRYSRGGLSFAQFCAPGERGGSRPLSDSLPPGGRYDARQQCPGCVDCRFSQSLDHDPWDAVSGRPRLRRLSERRARVFYGRRPLKCSTCWIAIWESRRIAVNGFRNRSCRSIRTMARHSGGGTD